LNFTSYLLLNRSRKSYLMPSYNRKTTHCSTSYCTYHRR